jgi:guanosine-3',5'-bis(diphosphate) 3'-pyrophosphohydrolase
MNVQEFAVKAHGQQMYGDEPYIVHLIAVEKILIRFGHTDEPMLQAAWLHDVVEDTQTTLEDIKTQFGKTVADIVSSVTSESGINRKERNTKTYPKIAASRPGTILKLADRIANVEHSINTQSPLLKMYRKEYADFQAALPHTDENQAMWAYLDRLLA